MPTHKHTIAHRHGTPQHQHTHTNTHAPAEKQQHAHVHIHYTTGHTTAPVHTDARAPAQAPAHTHTSVQAHTHKDIRRNLVSIMWDQSILISRLKRVCAVNYKAAFQLFSSFFRFLLLFSGAFLFLGSGLRRVLATYYAALSLSLQSIALTLSSVALFHPVASPLLCYAFSQTGAAALIQCVRGCTQVCV